MTRTRRIWNMIGTDTLRFDDIQTMLDVTRPDRFCRLAPCVSSGGYQDWSGKWRADITEKPVVSAAADTFSLMDGPCDGGDCVALFAAYE